MDEEKYTPKKEDVDDLIFQKEEPAAASQR